MVFKEGRVWSYCAFIMIVGMLKTTLNVKLFGNNVYSEYVYPGYFTYLLLAGTNLEYVLP